MKFQLIYTVTTPNGRLETVDKGAAVLRMADARVSGVAYTLDVKAVTR